MLHALRSVSFPKQKSFRMSAKHRLRDGAFLHVTLATLPNVTDRSQALERVASRQLSKWLSLHCLASTPILSVLSDTFMRMNGRQNVTADDAGKARMEVARDIVAQNLPFWAQGNGDLNTQAALEARARLRNEPGLVTELQRWWETAQRSLQSVSDTSRDVLSRDEYLHLSRLLSKALTPKFDPSEAQLAAEEDWEVDSDVDGRMTRGRFMDAIFECARACHAAALSCPYAHVLTCPSNVPRRALWPGRVLCRVCALPCTPHRLADAWTLTVDVNEYMEFLASLFERIAAQPLVRHTAHGLWYWRHEKDVTAGSYADDLAAREEQLSRLRVRSSSRNGELRADLRAWSSSRDGELLPLAQRHLSRNELALAHSPSIRALTREANRLAHLHSREKSTPWMEAALSAASAAGVACASPPPPIVQQPTYVLMAPPPGSRDAQRHVRAPKSLAVLMTEERAESRKGKPLLPARQLASRNIYRTVKQPPELATSGSVPPQGAAPPRSRVLAPHAPPTSPRHPSEAVGADLAASTLGPEAGVTHAMHARTQSLPALNEPPADSWRASSAAVLPRPAAIRPARPATPGKTFAQRRMLSAEVVPTMALVGPEGRARALARSYRGKAFATHVVRGLVLDDRGGPHLVVKPPSTAMASFSTTPSRMSSLNANKTAGPRPDDIATDDLFAAQKVGQPLPALDEAADALQETMKRSKPGEGSSPPKPPRVYEPVGSPPAASPLLQNTGTYVMPVHVVRPYVLSFPARREPGRVGSTRASAS